MFSVRKTGDWDKVSKLLHNLSTNMFSAFKVEIQDNGELFLQAVVDHIDNQDLSWEPLSDRTIELKGGDDTIYVETGFLRDNLKALKVTSTMKKISFFVGAPSTVRTSEGVKLSDLMVWLEYGTDKITARPLLRPTWGEIEPVIKNNLRTLVESLLRGDDVDA